MQISHVSVVCKLYSQVFEEAVCGSEHPEFVDDCPAAVVSGQDLDADLPRPGPLRGLQASHYTRRTWLANQCPVPTALQTQSNQVYMQFLK